MNNDDYTCHEFCSSDSCGDVNDEDSADHSLPRRQRLKGSSLRSPQQPLLFSSEKDNPLRHRSKNPARTSPPPPPKLAAIDTAVNITRKSPFPSRQKSTRKLRSRPRVICGNLSDTSTSSSNSSSDDSLLFRNSHSFTSTMKIAAKKLDIDKTTKKGSNPKNDVNCLDHEKICSDVGAGKINVGKKKSDKAFIQKLQTGSDNKKGGGSSDSDSDDTAELVRQLTHKPASCNTFTVESSSSSEKLTGISSSSMELKSAPSMKTNGPEKPTQRPCRFTEQNHNDGDDDDDDERSLNGDRDDVMDDSVTRQHTSLPSNSCKGPPKLNSPKDVCSNSNSEAICDFKTKSAPDKFSHYDNNDFDPVRFELPPQSSSSEESSAPGEEDEFSDGDMVEIRNNNEMADNKVLGKKAIAEDNTFPYRQQNSQNQSETIRCQENHLSRQGHCDPPLPSITQLNNRHQHQHACIDLVDSDESGQENRTLLEDQQNQFRDKHCKRRWDPSDRSTTCTHENDESQRSPNLRRSPRFNVTARNFIYKKPWAKMNNLGNKEEENDDVLQFNDDDTKLPARPRRVTQDHANQIDRHNCNHADDNVYGQAVASNSFQHCSPSNPPYRREQQLQHQRPQQAAYRQSGVSNIPRPWPSNPLRRTRRMRDPAASNVLLASSVVLTQKSLGVHRASNSNTQDATDSSRKSKTEHSTQENCSKNTDNCDIRTFLSKRPSLVNETRSRAEAIEKVRANRHDIEGHTNVAVVSHTQQPTKSAGRSRPRRLPRDEEVEDVIEVFDDDEYSPPVRKPTRRSRAVAAKSKAQTKGKRTTTRRTRSRKTGGRKRTRKSASTSSGRGRSRGGGGRFARRGGNATGGDDDSGAWGSTGGGWTSERPVHREDPAFRNVGAEITF